MVPVLLLTLLIPSTTCPFQVPVSPGTLMAVFAPSGSYGGHWGIDLAAAPGTPVHAVADGVVTFAGSIAGRRSVTIHHGGGVRTSYSYLARIEVGVGSSVRRGAVLGRSGTAHGTDALHFSVRVGDRYVSPAVPLCPEAPGHAVRLGGSRTYPVRRANRHPRGNLRPAPPGSSGRRRSRLSRARPQQRVADAGGVAVAEGRA